MKGLYQYQFAVVQEFVLDHLCLIHTFCQLPKIQSLLLAWSKNIEDMSKRRMRILASIDRYRP